jgi:hypothetical protein
MAARSWLAAEQERLAHLAALVRRGEKLPELPDEEEPPALEHPAPVRQAPPPPRWQQVQALERDGLSRAEIAEQLGIGERRVRFYEGESRARERAIESRYEGQGSVGQTAAMVRVYPDQERREWIRREMALRDELIEQKARRGR